MGRVASLVSVSLQRWFFAVRSRLCPTLVLAGALAASCGGSGGRGSAPVAAPTAAAAAAQERAQQELAALSDAFEALAREPSLLAHEAAIEPHWAAVQRDLHWLERRAASWQAAPSLEPFVAALAEHRQLLHEVRLATSAEALPVVEALIRDVHVKAEQCRRFGGPVPVGVSVITRDTAHREVTGYEVWFVRKAYERKPSTFRRFERNSSPAARTFEEAGYYVLWAALPGRAPSPSSVRLDVEVGATEREQVFDLTAPAHESGPGSARDARASSDAEP
jgi:hypothetical protein